MDEIIRDISTMKTDVVVLTETKRREQKVNYWEITYTFLAK